MTSSAPINTELMLAVSLGSSITLYRPATLAEGSGSAWKQIDDETEIAILSDRNYRLRLRIVAQDPFGDPISDPAWMVTAHTTVSGSSWQPVADNDSNGSHFLTTYAQITETPRRYRFIVGIPNSGISSSFEVSIRRGSNANAADGPVLDDGDFKPPENNGPQGNTPSPSLVAGNLAAPL